MNDGVRGGVYAAPISASKKFTEKIRDTRNAVRLVEMFGNWTASPLGLQHILPHITLGKDEGAKALLTTSARPTDRLAATPTSPRSLRSPLAM